MTRASVTRVGRSVTMRANSESELLAQILLACSRGDTRLIRVNAGVAWQGRVLEQSANRLVLAYPRAVRLASEGVSDLIGFKGARFAAIEVKSARGRVRPEQQAFIDLVRVSGGLAGIARSVEDAEKILAGVLR